MATSYTRPSAGMGIPPGGERLDSGEQVSERPRSDRVGDGAVEALRELRAPIRQSSSLGDDVAPHVGNGGPQLLRIAKELVDDLLSEAVEPQLDALPEQLQPLARFRTALAFLIHTLHQGEAKIAERLLEPAHVRARVGRVADV